MFYRSLVFVSERFVLASTTTVRPLALLFSPYYYGLCFGKVACRKLYTCL